MTKSLTTPPPAPAPARKTTKVVEIVKVRTEDLKPGMIVHVNIAKSGAATPPLMAWAEIGNVVDGQMHELTELYGHYDNPDAWPFANIQKPGRPLHDGEVAFYVDVPDYSDGGWEWHVKIARRHELWDVQVATETLNEA